MSVAPRDYLDRARTWAASALFLAAMLVIVGSFLEWVIVAELPRVIPEDQAARAAPFTGAELGDGWWTAAMGVVMAATAVLIVLRGTSGWPKVALLATIVAGGIAISDYRAIDDVFLEAQGIGADPSQGVGLILVTAGAMLGLISSVAAIAATPSRRDS